MSDTVAATPARIEVEYVFRLDEPRPVSDQWWDHTILATDVHWRHYVTVDDRSEMLVVTAFTKQFDNVTLAYGRDLIPSWVPRPPDGWDAAVAAFAAEHAAESAS